MQCPNCGQEAQGKFCRSCGQELAATPAGAQTQRMQFAAASASDSAATAVLQSQPAALPYPRPPLSTGQLFNDSFHLYRRNLPLLAGVMAPLAIAQVLLSILITAVHLPGGVSGALTSFFFPLSMGVLALPVTARYLDRPMSVGQVYAILRGAGILGLLVAGALLYALSVLVGSIFLVIPGIYVMVRFLFTTQVIALERADIRAAFARSSELVKGTWWRVFGLFILFDLPAIPGVIVVGGVRALVNATLGATASDIWILFATAFLIPLIIFPIPVSALVMLYYDLRVRKEGFHLEDAARSLEA